MFFTCIYRSPSQNKDEFKNFCTNFDILFNNINDELPLCSIVTGDFNARCSSWWKNDITNLQGQEVDYRQPPWMTDNIKKFLKGRCNLTKIF